MAAAVDTGHGLVRHGGRKLSDYFVFNTDHKVIGIQYLVLTFIFFIFGGILAILFVVAFNMIFAPMRAEQASLEKAITAKFEQTGKLQAEAKHLSEQLVQDPNAANRARVADLKTLLAATEAEVAVVTRGLVSPKDMARMVEQILATNRAVQVVRVENLPSLSLLDPPADRLDRGPRGSH